MSCGMRPGSGLPAASHHEAARPWDTAAGRTGLLNSRRVRPSFCRGWLWLWVLAIGALLATARLPGMASDVRAAFAYPGGLRPAWLGVAAAAELASLAGGAAAQRQLLAAGGAQLPWRTVLGVVLASTGLARVMPAGPVAGGAWQVREYRRRGAGAAAGVWAVLAGGFTSIVAALGLLSAGAAVAGTSSLPLLACTGAALAACVAGLAAPRRAHALSRWLARYHRRSPTIARLAAALAAASGQRAGFRRGAVVLACTAAGLLADAGVLAACFGLAGLPVPWRGLLFAYAAGQLAGRLVPLPGGLGGVEGGVLGGLMLTGIPPAAAAAAVLVYRVAGYWAVGTAGTAVAVTFARRRSAGRDAATRRSPCEPTAGRPISGQLLHRPRGTAVPCAAAETFHPSSPPSGDGLPAARS
jgi:uncharacterized membrane protein YbhN (UPF0104 family)